MSSFRLARVLGALGVSGALAAGALAAGASSASAVTATSNYNCSGSMMVGGTPSQLPPSAATVKVSVPTLAAKAGQTISSIPTTATATLPSSVSQQLAPLTLIYPDLTGTVSLPLNVAGASVPFNLTTPTPMAFDPIKLAGNLADQFAVPSAMAPGYYKVNLPNSFTLNFSSAQAGGQVGSATCTRNTGANSLLGWFTVLNKNGTAPAKPTAFSAAAFVHSTVTTAQRAVASVAVKTTSGGGTPTGRVIALLRGKQVGSAPLSGGRARITLPKLAKGTDYVTVRYVGSSAYKAVSKTLKLTVKRA